ncbi:cysteine and glycine-rich protein 2 binding protein [Anaeramoeba flamelloides]|uniref:Cysteine and glycine-rich protein 2 binding protein n=1 Tax=Anaeramoeba flamelloides TaxID=1746091 RepID=A0ABQ8YNR7_9EUKA|nr:cysteine and glycine-rich protein 2 binding protein [Anaeramoeba flamelloides]
MSQNNQIEINDEQKTETTIENNDFAVPTWGSGIFNLNNSSFNNFLQNSTNEKDQESTLSFYDPQFIRRISSSELRGIMLPSAPKESNSGSCDSGQQLPRRPSVLYSSPLRKSSHNIKIETKSNLQQDQQFEKKKESTIIPEMNEFKDVESHFEYPDSETEEFIQNEQEKLYQRTNTVVFVQPTNSQLQLMESKFQKEKEEEEEEGLASEDDEEATELPQTFGSEQLNELLGFENLNIEETLSRRKRELKVSTSKTQRLSRFDSSVVESGKDVFKLMAGQLWVITGGGSIKILKPYTNTFADKIGEIFEANPKEVQTIKSTLKYLLSNSRRTFTEFILEIFLGVLSLKFAETVPQISLDFWEVIKQLSEINQNENKNKNKNENEDEEDDDNNENDEEDENSKEISSKLETIYQKIYTQEVLMYWFNKRFSERLGKFFTSKDQKQFYEQHMFFLGKSKFLLGCMLLSKEMFNRLQDLERYFFLITRSFDGNALNLFLHNRGQKLQMVKALTNEFGLNNGEYWKIISNDYVSRMPFGIKDVIDFFPFVNIIGNPKLITLTLGKAKEKPQKFRQTPLRLSDVEIPFNNNWLHKKKK